MSNLKPQTSRILFAATFIVMLMCALLVPQFAQAVEKPSSILAEGTTGTCSWFISGVDEGEYTKGELYVYPTEGSSGEMGYLNQGVGNSNKVYVESASFAPGVKLSPRVDADGMFLNFELMESVDLSNLDISGATSTCQMFYDCRSLRSVDVSTLDTSNVTNFHYMFGNCGSLSEIVGIESLDTSKAVNMYRMFGGCSSLKTLNLTSFNVSQVTDMRGMFIDCASLQSLELSSFGSSKVTSLWHMFSGCKSLTSIDLSNFVTPYLTDIRMMFAGDTKLTELDVSGMDTSRVVEETQDVFMSTKNIKSITVGTGWKAEVPFPTGPCGVWRDGGGQTYASGATIPTGTAATYVSEHVWGDYVVKTAATCVAVGQKVKTCSACGQTEYAVISIDSTAHDWSSDYEVTTAPTCSKEGVGTYTCRRCSQTKTVAIPIDANAHTWGGTSVVRAATCEADGVGETVCKDCGKSNGNQVVIPALGHKWVTTSESPATCETDGKTVKTCENCQQTSTEVTPALGHKWSQTDEVKATCETKGSLTEVCEKCKKSKQTEIPALGHDWKTLGENPATCETSGSITRECNVCAKTETTEIPAIGHAWIQVKGYAAKVGVEGLTDGVQCSACGAWQIEQEILPAIASQDITPAKTKATIKYKNLKKKTQKVTITIDGAKTALASSKLTGKNKKAISKITIKGNKVTITLKKGAKKGTYKIGFYAKANSVYASSSTKYITIKVK